MAPGPLSGAFALWWRGAAWLRRGREGCCGSNDLRSGTCSEHGDVGSSIPNVWMVILSHLPIP